MRADFFSQSSVLSSQSLFVFNPFLSRFPLAQLSFPAKDNKGRGGDTMQEITATELKEKIDSGEDIALIDVRNPDEFAFAKID